MVDRAGLQSGASVPSWAQIDGQVKSKYIETTRPNVQPVRLQESEGVLQGKIKHATVGYHHGEPWGAVQSPTENMCILKMRVTSKASRWKLGTI